MRHSLSVAGRGVVRPAPLRSADTLDVKASTYSALARRIVCLPVGFRRASVHISATQRFLRADGLIARHSGSGRDAIRFGRPQPQVGAEERKYGAGGDSFR